MAKRSSKFTGLLSEQKGCNQGGYIKGFIYPPGKHLCAGPILSFLPAFGSAPHTTSSGPAHCSDCPHGWAGSESLFGASRYGPSLPDNLDIKRGSPTQYGRTLCLPVTTAHDETPWKTTVENSVRVLISFSKFYLLFSEEERLRVLLLRHSVIKQE